MKLGMTPCSAASSGGIFGHNDGIRLPISVILRCNTENAAPAHNARCHLSAKPSNAVARALANRL
jgi:hypothetical protein